MELEFEGKTYSIAYFPFFRMKKADDYHTFGLRFPSGRIDKVIVVNTNNCFPELRKYLEYLIKEFLLNDEALLSPRRKKLKDDVHELFGQKR